MLRLSSIALAVFMWLFATNHCLLAGVIDLHGCTSGECAGEHGLDHNHGCDSNCHALVKNLVPKDVREKASLVPAQTADVFAVLAILEDSSHLATAAPILAKPRDERLVGWIHTWHLRTRAARLPGAPSAA